MKRVKEIREKQSNGSFNNSSIPIGTDGILVDMLSGLDNEQELKLGGNHSSTITEVSNTVTTVEEVYYALDNETVVYQLSTTITEQNHGSTIITCVLKDSAGTVLKTKTITIPADAASIMIGEVLS